MFYGEYVRQLRLSRRITLRHFCFAMEIDAVHESEIERGISEPHKETMRTRIADSLCLVKDEINTMNRLANEYKKQEEKIYFPAFPLWRISDATQHSPCNLDSRK